MFSIKDSKDKLIKSWSLTDSKTLNQCYATFIVHQSRLIDFYEDQDAVVVVYGFIDQETDGLNKAEFVARQLVTKGSDGLNDLYGSFIVIHYDKNKDHYLIANDAMGDFAVHYYIKEGQLWISEFPEALLDVAGIAMNPQRLLHYFALTQPQNNGSFFANIQQLNPGQYLESKGQSHTVNTYYKKSQVLDSNIKSIDELSEQLTSLMLQILSFQCQSDVKVGVKMSGGMDSTFVSANLLQLKKKLNTYSYVFPNMPQANESLWIDAMRSKPLHMHTFSGEPHWPLKKPWFISSNTPTSNPYRHIKNIIYQKAQSENISTVLTGVFADHLYVGHMYWMVDLLKSHPFKAIKTLYTIMREDGFMTAMRQISPAKWKGKQPFLADWLTTDAQQKLKDYIKNTASIPKHPHHQQYALCYGLSTAQSCWLENEYAFKYDVSVRHPYRDRRLVELLMSVPAWILGDHKEPKKLVKNAAENLLPANIIRRKKITSLKPLFIEGVLKQELHKVKKLLLAKDCNWGDYVDSKRILPLINDPQKDHKDTEYMLLWQCISYELWKRKLAAKYVS